MKMPSNLINSNCTNSDCDNPDLDKPDFNLVMSKICIFKNFRII